MIKFRHSCRGGHILLSIATKVHINMLSLLLAQSLLRSSIFKLLFLNLCFDKREGFAARAAAGHFLLPIAAKGSKSAFRLPKQKARISARSVFSHTLSDGSWEVFFYHNLSVNAVLLSISFSLPTWAAVGEWVLCCSLVSALCFLVYI